MFDPASMPIYLAIAEPRARSRMEDMLVLDNFRVATFRTATAVLERFRQAPARMIIADRRFADGFSALDLARTIRQEFLLPYVYIAVMSQLGNLPEVRAGLEAGVDDYLIKPTNMFQLRTRVLVGQRWLNYIDSITQQERA
jgi:DNA-binding response OmpR family regulator